MGFLNMGQELADIKFGDLIFSMAKAIADSQVKLDMSSLQTLKVLANLKFDWIPAITEVLEPVQNPPITVTTPDGNTTTLTTTGVQVDTTISDPAKLTLLQAGITPTFYQFTESDITIVISLKATVSTDTEVDGGFEFSQDVTTQAGGGFDLGLFSASGSVSTTTHFASHVNFSNSTKYSYEAQGSATLKTTLKPVQAPARVLPKFITVNALVNPPQITNS